MRSGGGATRAMLRRLILDATIPAKNRYCGSKYPHDAHEWRQIGRPEGPVFQCRGKVGTSGASLRGSH